MADQLMSLEYLYAARVAINEALLDTGRSLNIGMLNKLFETARAAHEWKERCNRLLSEERSHINIIQQINMASLANIAEIESLRKENEKLRQQSTIAEEFMKKLPAGYSWNDCPTEYVADLQNQVHDLKDQLRTARMEERERCAKVCELATVPEFYVDDAKCIGLTHIPTRAACTARIRALGDAE